MDICTSQSIIIGTVRKTILLDASARYSDKFADPNLEALIASANVLFEYIMGHIASES